MTKCKETLTVSVKGFCKFAAPGSLQVSLAVSGARRAPVLSRPPRSLTDLRLHPQAHLGWFLLHFVSVLLMFEGCL